MKKITIRILALTTLIIASCFFVSGLQKVFFNFSGEEPQRLKAFYLEEKNTLDVVVIGSSEIKLGYSAPEVYKQTGITSFPYCCSVNPVTLWKYELNDIKKYQNPKVVIVEINGAIYEKDKHILSKGAFYKLTESMPLSINKYNLVKDRRPEGDKILDVMIPFIKYHGKWNDVFDNTYYKDNIMQIKRGYAVLRGAQTPLDQDEIAPEGPYPGRDEKLKLNKNAEPALREFLDICKEDEDTDYVFVQFPHLMTEELSYTRSKRYNEAAEIIQEYGFEYIDYSAIKDEIGLDPKIDFYDSEHMNAGGQRKLSIYMVGQIAEKYGLEPSELSSKQRETWENSIDYINRFYKYYDDYRNKHNNDGTKAGFSLKESCEVIKKLDEME